MYNVGAFLFFIHIKKKPQNVILTHSHENICILLPIFMMMIIGLVCTKDTCENPSMHHVQAQPRTTTATTTVCIVSYATLVRERISLVPSVMA